MSNIDKLKPGKYAILFRNNWDGEGDTYETFAILDAEGIWRDEDGDELLEYQDDEVLKAWPMDDGSNVLALLDELEAETSYREGAFIACNRWHDKFRESEAKLEAAEKRIAELEAQEIQPVGMQLIKEAIGAHGYIVGCLQQNRPDLALQESLKWMQAFGQAAQIAAGTDKGE